MSGRAVAGVVRLGIVGAVLMAGCPAPLVDEPPPPPCVAGACECHRDVDCALDSGEPSVCYQREGRARVCVLSCEEDGDCVGPGRVPGLECAVGSCLCRDGACRVGPCQTDAACPETERCRAGRCEPPGPVAERCTFHPQHLILRETEQRPVRVVFAAGDQRVVPEQEVVLEGLEASVVRSVPGTSAFVGVAAGEATLQASADGVSCQATATVLPPLAAGELRVVAFERATGIPIGGLRVLIEHEGGTQVERTARDGVVFSVGEGVETSVHLFSPDGWTARAPNGWEKFSLLGTRAREIFVPLSPVVRTGWNNAPVEVFGLWQTPSVDQIPDLSQRGGMEVFQLGTAFSPGLVDLQLDEVIGAQMPRGNDGGTGGWSQPLPSGFFLRIRTLLQLNQASTRGPAGWRTPWALAAVLTGETTMRIGEEIGLTGEPGNDGILAALLPCLDTEAVGIVGAPRLAEAAFPVGDQGWERDLAPVSLTPRTAWLRRKTIWLPPLPAFTDLAAGQPMIAVAALEHLPGEGLVPLGLLALPDAIAEAPGDGVVELPAYARQGDRAELPAGVALLDHAAPLGDGPRRGVAVAFEAAGLDSERRHLPWASILLRPLVAGEDRIDLSQVTFPSLPAVTLEVADRRLIAPAPEAGGIHGILLTDPEGDRWLILTAGGTRTFPDAVCRRVGFASCEEEAWASLEQRRIEASTDGASLDELVGRVEGLSELGLSLRSLSLAGSSR